MPAEYFEARERALLGERYDTLYAAPQETAARGVTVPEFLHAGGVAAAGENTDRLDLLFHREIPSNLFLHIPLGARASPSSTDAARLDATYLLWLALDKYITKLII